MAIQSNFPVIKPSLMLDFANTQQLDPRITFTRASTATYYDGVTTAMAEQNLLLQSQTFTITWSITATNTALTANTTTAPDGTSTATLFYEATTATSFKELFQAQTFVSGANYTFSVYAKASTSTVFQMFFPTGVKANAYANFDLSGGVLGTVGAGCTATITSVGNGWYRCTVSISSAIAATNYAFICLVNNSTTSAIDPSYAGTVGNGVYVWGAQIEQRSAVTAYTATTTQVITNYIPVLKTAASGVARFDCNPTTDESLGLLIEEQRTNLLLYSSQLDINPWIINGITNVSITANTVVAPDGTLSGDLLKSNSATNDFVSQIPALATSTVATFSFYIKNVDSVASRIMARTSVTSMEVAINWSGATLTSLTLVTGTSASFSAVGNGWYRVQATFTTGENNQQIRIYPDNANSGKSIFAWGAQLEAGAFATSYIPTVASQVTRAADLARMIGTNFSTWYSQPEGTLYVDMIYDVSATFVPAPLVYQGSNINANAMGFYNNTTTAILGSIRANSINIANISKTPTTFLGNHKMAFGYKVGDAGFTLDGQTAGTATPTVLPLVDTLSIGGSNVSYFQNTAAVTHIKKIAYYPLRVTNANLQALTS